MPTVAVYVPARVYRALGSDDGRVRVIASEALAVAAGVAPVPARVADAVRPGLSTGEVLPVPPPVAGAVSPVPSPLTAGAPGTAAPDESRVAGSSPSSAPAVSGPKQFRPDPKKKP